MINFVFCHGFAFNQNFWCNLTQYFAGEKCTYLDSEYYNSPSSPITENKDKIIAIGHSLGLLKLLCSGIKFDYIIGLNGFINFLGNDPCLQKKRRVELETLKQNFIKNPLLTLKSFYKRCGVPSFLSQIDNKKINLDTMLMDLHLLNSNINLPTNIPVLILGSEDDKIVPPALIYDNFDHYSNAEINITNKGKHGLGYLEEAYIYKKIMSFIDDRIKS